MVVPFHSIAMSPTFAADPLPLRQDEGGAIRVGASRVLLDTLIFAYRSGQSPEEIAGSYPAVQLSDVYSIIGYYLAHRAEVDAYVDSRRQQADALRRRLETEGIAPTDVGEMLDRIRRRLESSA